MEQELSFTERVTVENVALFIWADMHSDDERLSVFYSDIGILDIDLSHANALHLGADERNAALIRAFDEIFVPGLAVFGQHLDPGLNGHSILLYVVLQIQKNAAFTFHKCCTLTRQLYQMNRRFPESSSLL